MSASFEPPLPDPGPASSADTGQVRVLVVSDQPLVADAVRTALHSQDLNAVGATMSHRPVTRGQVQRLRQLEPDVVLVLSDLTRESRLAAARSLIEGLRLPTVVLATTEDDALWGGVLESGATAVLPASAGLDETVRLLRGVCRGIVTPALRRREEMIRAWHRAVEARMELTRRLGSLSPRELDVLRLLYRGETVDDIATRSGVTIATVRSQVRSVRRKLGVSSQLAAVAAYARRGVVGSSPELDSM